MALIKILYTVYKNTLAFGLQLMLNPYQIIYCLQWPGTACLLSLQSILWWPMRSTITLCSVFIIWDTAGWRNRHLYASTSELSWASSSELNYLPFSLSVPAAAGLEPLTMRWRGKCSTTVPPLLAKIKLRLPVQRAVYAKHTKKFILSCPV